ncbi:interferon-induced, double-stranded RNA-activated protein kinase-like isoform X2 [Megalobrama amblycephala]|uniref:interferon-induced, double-stranded RNA-activated protein kinase-like isoform X2 n=1 Tax=Megalobrama amblycephala TaxID=75352 RepID=UPI002014066D|nr:interferon-induced, double-stranded RNA-activated protein kinase-like isoform X2 [Megalobrama amblycephala]
MESLSGNFISLLNEYQQRSKCTVEYEEGSTEGPSHNKTFTMRVIINGQRYPDGTGKTKKEAKQSAAKNALNGIKRTHNTESDENSNRVRRRSEVASLGLDRLNLSTADEFRSSTPDHNYIAYLNDFCQKNKCVLDFKLVEKRGPPHNPEFVFKVVIDGKEYPEGQGKSSKEAKQHAAQNAWSEIRDQIGWTTQSSEDDTSSQTPETSTSLDRLNLSTADESRSSTPDHNYIAYLNDFCQKNKSVLDFKLVEKRGPPHNPEFVFKVVIDGKKYPEGQGKSSKEAKQHAAQNAWSEIRDQIGWTTQSSDDDTSSQTPETSKSEDARLSSNSSAETPSKSDFIVFKDSSAVCSPMAISPRASPVDVRPRIKLAPTFQLSPNGLAPVKENAPNMNSHNLTKSSGDQPSNQATKSRFLEDFDSINPIGKGGFGRVFKARRKLENKYYAVKIVKSREKALREVGALAGFNNANIVRYYTAWEEDTAYKHESSETISDSGSGSGTKFLYIQMELCEGDTLRVWIDKRNSSNEHFPKRRTDAAQISRQVLTAVEYIHSEGLIHRDLKPPNIMFGNDGRVKVGDFGLVTAAENDNDELLLERTKRTGTRNYMSPEQATQTSYDRKVDIYALGLIYFELIYNLATIHEKRKIWEDIRRRVFPQQFSRKFSFEHNLIQRMLSPSPEDRPDATELIRELDEYSTELEPDKDIKTM